MATSTLRIPAVFPDAAATPAPGRKGVLGRVLDRLIEARLRKAQAEIQHYHRHLLPAELERAGRGLNDRNEDELPFVR